MNQIRARFISKKNAPKNRSKVEPFVTSTPSHHVYLESFGWDVKNPKNSLKYEGTSRLAKAYEVALDIRKFEIELYWKRSTNFWLLIAAISTALGILATAGQTTGSPILSQSHRETGCLMLSSAATMLCIGWWLANKASKFWQRNWESQVDVLEQEVLGPLYKTVLSKKGEFSETTYFSVSDINKSASAYLGWIFLFLSFHFLGLARIPELAMGSFSQMYENFSFAKTIVLCFNLYFGMHFYSKNRTKTTDDDNRLDVDLGASTRRVQLVEIRASKEGIENLKPLSITKNPGRRSFRTAAKNIICKFFDSEK